MAKSRPIFPLLLVLLPLGLILGGIVSFFIYFEKLEREEELVQEAEERKVYRQKLLRKDPTENQLLSHVRLVTALGPRGASHAPEALQQTGLTIENALSGLNMGYVVTREVYDEGADGSPRRTNFVVEVEGRGPGIVLVGASYGSPASSPGADDNGSGIAVLLSLANAFVGTEPKHTLRFVAFADQEGAFHHATRSFDKEEKIVGVIGLHRLGVYRDEPATQKVPAPMAPGALPDTGNFLLVLGTTSSFELVESAIVALGDNKGLPVQSSTLPADALIFADTIQTPFWKWNAPGILVTSTGNLRDPRSGTSADTEDIIDGPRLLEATRGLQDLLATLGGVPQEEARTSPGPR